MASVKLHNVIRVSRGRILQVELSIHKEYLQVRIAYQVVEMVDIGMMYYNMVVPKVFVAD